MLATPEIAEYASLTITAAEVYARRHGYGFTCVRHVLDPTRPAAWSKLLLLERYFAVHPMCAWGFWLDADALIMNETVRLEGFLEDQVDLIIAAEAGQVSPINSGVFFLRNNARARTFLERVWKRTDLISHPWYEQPAMFAEMNAMPELRWRMVHQRLFNSFVSLGAQTPWVHPDGAYRPGDFIAHTPSIPPAPRLAALRALARQKTLPPAPTEWWTLAYGGLPQVVSEHPRPAPDAAPAERPAG